MYERKTFYKGNSEVMPIDELIKRCDGSLAISSSALESVDLFLIDNVTIQYEARKRLIPRGLNLWSVKVSLKGKDQEEVAAVEKYLCQEFAILPQKY